MNTYFSFTFNRENRPVFMGNPAEKREVKFVPEEGMAPTLSPDATKAKAKTALEKGKIKASKKPEMKEPKLTLEQAKNQEKGNQLKKAIEEGRFGPYGKPVYIELGTAGEKMNNAGEAILNNKDNPNRFREYRDLFDKIFRSCEFTYAKSMATMKKENFSGMDKKTPQLILDAINRMLAQYAGK